MSGTPVTPGSIQTRSRLGRGLSSLISSASGASPIGQRPDSFSCPLQLIDVGPGQPRKVFHPERLEELAASIRETGILQPLVVRTAAEGRYLLVAGERRLRASRMAGLTHVPVIVREIADSDLFAVALVENIQREDLNAIEEAEAYHRLIHEHGLTQDDLARKLGRDRSTVANALRLLRLAPAVQELVAEGSLSPGHARAVLSAPDDARSPLAERIVTDGLSVRQAEDLARRWKKGDSSTAARPTPAGAGEHPVESASSAARAVQRKLQERYATKVHIARRVDGSGELTFSFANDEGLQSLIELLLPRDP